MACEFPRSTASPDARQHRFEVVSHGELVRREGLFEEHHGLRYRELTLGQGYRTTVVNEQEFDEFDSSDATYVNCFSTASDAVVGCLRLLPTDRPHLISEVWPSSIARDLEYVGAHTWEGSRLCVDSRTFTTAEKRAEVVGCLLDGMEQACADADILSVIGSMAPEIWRSVFVLRGYSVDALGPEISMDGHRLSSRLVRLRWQPSERERA